MRVAVYQLPGNHNSMRTTTAMAEGAGVVGCESCVYKALQFEQAHVDLFNAACFWGYTQPCQNIFAAYRAAGKPVVYLDAGYWRRDAYYKVSVNARHPTAYFQRRGHAGDRAARFGVVVKEQAPQGAHILVAGMSPKSAWAEKLEPWGAYELAVMRRIRAVTDRPIIYRAKSAEIPAFEGLPTGVVLTNGLSPIAEALPRVWAVVTHHSNVAVNGLVEGVPAFVVEGVADPLALLMSSVSCIEYPLRPLPGKREQWVRDIAYCQWSLAEMKSGRVWRHLREEGLL